MSGPAQRAPVTTSGASHASTDEGLALARRIKRQANGLLGAGVYHSLMELARLAKPRTIVEIGTAHGAATIALALGARAGGCPCHIYTVDPFAGFSSRVKYGTVTDNLRIVREAFSHFGVSDCITVVVGTSADVFAHLPAHALDLVVIDADGRIDRDLAVLFDRMSEGANIVIDDVDGTTCLTRFRDRLYCDQKHRLTRLVVDRLLASGHLQGERVEESTGFYAKGSGTAATIEALALPAYRELVFTDVDDIATPKLQKGCGPWLQRRFAAARSVYRRLKAGGSRA
jgi:predicted O-methyltransferase YrrM